MENERSKPRNSPSRIRADSLFYTRVVPILLIAMGVITATLILLAAGVLIGVVPFR